MQRGGPMGRGMGPEMNIMRNMHKRKTARRADDRYYGAQPDSPPFSPPLQHCQDIHACTQCVLCPISSCMRLLLHMSGKPSPVLQTIALRVLTCDYTSEMSPGFDKHERMQ
jgi:hypothetical protein